MVNEIVPIGHVFVIQQDYYYRMVNDHIRICKVKHQATKILFKNLVENFSRNFIPKHQLFQVNMEDIDKVQELHN